MIHRRNNEPICDRCREAVNRYRFDLRRRHRDIKPLQGCGTLGGYHRHERRVEPICDACRVVKNQYNAERRLLKGSTPRAHDDTVDDLLAVLHGYY